jgi:hypothetical protein
MKVGRACTRDNGSVEVESDLVARSCIGAVNRTPESGYHLSTVRTSTDIFHYLWSQLLSPRHPAQLLRVIRLLKSLPLQH